MRCIGDGVAGGRGDFHAGGQITIRQAEQIGTFSGNAEWTAAHRAGKDLTANGHLYQRAVVRIGHAACNQLIGLRTYCAKGVSAKQRQRVQHRRQQIQLQRTADAGRTVTVLIRCRHRDG